MGEISSIVFAMKTRQAILTDDMKARKFAKEITSEIEIQTTPHLLGWLVFNRHIIDSEKNDVIEEHKHMDRPLAKYFEEMYQEALRCKSLAQFSIRVGIQKIKEEPDARDVQ